jgi:hypothetical protein
MSQSGKIIDLTNTGNVVGPGSSTTGDIVIFADTTGKLLADSGIAFTTDGTLAANSDALIPTEKAIKTYVDTGLALDLKKANNLSDLANAATSRTNLGVAIGTNVQAYSAQLDSIAAIGNGIVAHTAANTFTARTITGTANQITVTNGDGVAGNPTLSTPQDIATSSMPTFAGIISTAQTTPAAGQIGELISATATTGSLTSNVAVNITSVSLTAGVWDVQSYVEFDTTGTIAGNTQYFGAISTTTASLTGTGENGTAQTGGQLAVSGTNGVGFHVGSTRVTITSTTTIYLNCRGFASVTFTNVTATGVLRAARVA